jgi:hypothetical protein
VVLIAEGGLPDSPKGDGVGEGTSRAPQPVPHRGGSSDELPANPCLRDWIRGSSLFLPRRRAPYCLQPSAKSTEGEGTTGRAHPCPPLRGRGNPSPLVNGGRRTSGTTSEQEHRKLFLSSAERLVMHSASEYELYRSTPSKSRT